MSIGFVLISFSLCLGVKVSWDLWLLIGGLVCLFGCLVCFLVLVSWLSVAICLFGFLVLYYGYYD